MDPVKGRTAENTENNRKIKNKKTKISPQKTAEIFFALLSGGLQNICGAKACKKLVQRRSDGLRGRASGSVGILHGGSGGENGVGAGFAAGNREVEHEIISGTAGGYGSGAFGAGGGDGADGDRRRDAVNACGAGGPGGTCSACALRDFNFPLCPR